MSLMSNQMAAGAIIRNTFWFMAKRERSAKTALELSKELSLVDGEPFFAQIVKDRTIKYMTSRILEETKSHFLNGQ